MRIFGISWSYLATPFNVEQFSGSHINSLYAALVILPGNRLSLFAFIISFVSALVQK